MSVKHESVVEALEKFKKIHPVIFGTSYETDLRTLWADYCKNSCRVPLLSLWKFSYKIPLMDYYCKYASRCGSLANTAKEFDFISGKECSALEYMCDNDSFSKDVQVYKQLSNCLKLGLKLDLKTPDLVTSEFLIRWCDCDALVDTIVKLRGRVENEANK